MNLACTGSDPASPKFLIFYSLWICGINFDVLGIPLKYLLFWDFPGRPVIKSLCFHCSGHEFDLSSRS